MRIRRVALVLVAGVALAGCSLVSTTGAPRVINHVPLDLLQPTIPGTNGARVHFITQPVYIVDATGHLTASSRIVPSPAKLSTVIEQLLLGPSTIEKSAGYTSALPTSLVLVSASVHNGVGVIDLATPLSKLPKNQQLLAVGQLVLTAGDVGATRGIILRVAGVTQSVLLPSQLHATLVNETNFQVLLNG